MQSCLLGDRLKPAAIRRARTCNMYSYLECTRRALPIGRAVVGARRLRCFSGEHQTLTLVLSRRALFPGTHLQLQDKFSSIETHGLSKIN